MSFPIHVSLHVEFLRASRDLVEPGRFCSSSNKLLLMPYILHLAFDSYGHHKDPVNA